MHCRVREPPGFQANNQAPALIPPWSAQAADNAVAISQPEAAAAGMWTDQQQQQQHTASTEVGAFEPLPDSPTGVRTAAGRSLDQQRDSQEVKQQLAAEMIAKLSPRHMPVAQLQHKVTPQSLQAASNQIASIAFSHQQLKQS